MLRKWEADAVDSAGRLAHCRGLPRPLLLSFADEKPEKACK